MVVNSPLVVEVANVSAEVCQYIACNPERLSREQVLHLLCCLPFQHFRRIALALWTFFCFPPPDSYSDFSSSSSSSTDFDYDSHSD